MIPPTRPASPRSAGSATDSRTRDDPEMTETRKLFHEELDEVNADVIHLGALASEAIEAATGALLDGDLAAAERMVAHDRELDDLTHSIEDRTYLLLARQQ